MAICNTAPEPVPERSFRGIADHIRRKVIYEGLELEEIGVDLAEVTDDVRLFDENGLNLDSIDALEILAGVQREFGLSIPNVDQEFMNEHCATVERLTRMVQTMSGKQGVRGSARDAAVTGRSRGGGVEHVSADTGTGSVPASGIVGNLPCGGIAGAQSTPSLADA